VKEPKFSITSNYIHNQLFPFHTQTKTLHKDDGYEKCFTVYFCVSSIWIGVTSDKYWQC